MRQCEMCCNRRCRLHSAPQDLSGNRVFTCKTNNVYSGFHCRPRAAAMIRFSDGSAYILLIYGRTTVILSRACTCRAACHASGCGHDTCDDTARPPLPGLARKFKTFGCRPLPARKHPAPRAGRAGVTFFACKTDRLINLVCWTRVCCCYCCCYTPRTIWRYATF